eukprot:CAMPEP_0173098350 /NCGR_PEP_ID=MMETSP1102-20130122/34667_1 /TAXON_ID=49646 /ORGANISM="Geminigera sp., Strain Caron Lab Isolate" /LENGTH=56 /DNA_ID=CAMNT_0013990807 /DNA_START=83 /DNA_END=250 /DNA_ORIENTATION=-
MTTASPSNTSSAPPTNAGSSWCASVPLLNDHWSPFSITTAVKPFPQATAIAGACRA